MTKLENLYAYPTEWQNYGDINPERYGGIFVKWEGHMWKVIETRHYADLPKDLSENEHMFEHMWIEPMDIWVNSEPYEGFTERMLNGFDSFSSLPFDPTMSESELPDSETYQDYVNHYLENEWESLLPYVIYHMRGYVDSRPVNFSPEYWNYLEKYGINRKDF